MKTCKIDGCDKPSRRLGWCNAHHLRYKRLGDPLGGGPSKGRNLQFIKDHVDHEEVDKCLIWPYSRDDSGYANAKMTEIEETHSASRIMCTLSKGKPPTSSHQAAHSCGKGCDGCINPNHLSWKTSKENIADKEIHGTSNKGERNVKAKLSVDDVKFIRSSEKSNVELALCFSVDKSTIGDIRRRKTWTHVE